MTRCLTMFGRKQLGGQQFGLTVNSARIRNRQKIENY